MEEATEIVEVVDAKEEMSKALAVIESANKATDMVTQLESALAEVAEERTYEIDLDGFDIKETVTETIKEYVGTKGEMIDNGIKSYLEANRKEIAADVARKLRPIVISISETVKIEIGDRVHKAFEECLFLANQERQLFMSGPAGSGKTTLASNIAKALNLNFAHVSCSSGMSEAHLLGRMLFDGTYVPADFVTTYENGGVFLFDEVDAADANTMLIINSALANGILSVPNRKEKNHATRHKDFICICAGNTWGTGSLEYQGRNHLDAAFLDRFAVSKVFIDYDTELERDICGDYKELFTELSYIRQRVKEHRVRRVLSTRAFISGTRQMKMGRTIKQIADTFFIGWSNEEIAKVYKK